MIWHVLKKSVTDIWDELLYGVVFNAVWVVGTVLILPWPFVTFGLFFIARDIGDGKGIKFGKFFYYGRQNWKPAYIWGGINLAALIILWLNINFYGGINARWAGLLQVFFVALTIAWSVLQLIALGLYPRLIEPSFKLALRNSAVITSRYPLLVLVLVVVIALLTAVSVFFPVIIFVLPFVAIAILTNNVVDAALSRELEHLQ